MPVRAIALWPLAQLYDGATRLRFRFATPYPSTLPVLCIGNFTAGGSGKTPMALAMAEVAKSCGLQPWFLSRGYGGNAQGAVEVIAGQHTAVDVGDEPLLLARIAPTVVSRDRVAGAKLIEQRAPRDSLIIMDDGLQNPGVGKDVAIAVVSTVRGLGNGYVIPAGPLRAGLGFQRGLVDAVIMSGANTPAAAQRRSQSFADWNVPVVDVAIVTRPTGKTLQGRAFLAYAGIANPKRFFDAVAAEGGTLAAVRAFADHAMIDADAARRLIDDANRLGATLITTEKDHVRLRGMTDVRAALRDASWVLPIAARMDGETVDQFKRLIELAIARWRARTP